MAMSKFMRTMFVKKMKAARAIVCTKEELEEREWGRSRLRLEAQGVGEKSIEIGGAPSTRIQNPPPCC